MKVRQFVLDVWSLCHYESGSFVVEHARAFLLSLPAEERQGFVSRALDEVSFLAATPEVESNGRDRTPASLAFELFRSFIADIGREPNKLEPQTRAP